MHATDRKNLLQLEKAFGSFTPPFFLLFRPRPMKGQIPDELSGNRKRKFQSREPEEILKEAMKAIHRKRQQRADRLPFVRVDGYSTKKALPILTSGLQGETLFPVMVAKLEERRCRA